MKKNLMIVCFAILALLLNAKTSSAQLLFEENFDYTIGAKLTDNGWTAHSGAGTNPISVVNKNLTYTNYPANAGKAVAILNSGEDVNKSFTSNVTTNSVYTAFLVTIDSAVTSAEEYFFHLAASPIGTDFKAKVFTKKDASGKVRFGLSKGGVSNANTGFDFNIGQTCLLVLKYKIKAGVTNDSVFLFVNPNPLLAETAPTLIATDITASDLANVGRVVLRQGTAGNGVKTTIDGIRVSTTWADALGQSSSLTPPSLTAAAAASVMLPFDVTFTENATWRDSIYQITFDGNVLPIASYNKTVAGKITFDPSQSAFLQTAKTANIVIKANGYSNATVSQILVAGTADATNSSVSISTPLAINSSSTITVTAKDLYGNLVSGYVFKYGVTVLNTNVTTNESYTVGGVAYTATTTDVALTATNASGVATYNVVIPATVDGNDGVKVRTYMNDGISSVGAEYSYIASTNPSLNISGTFSEATLSSDTLYISLANEKFVDASIDPASIALNNVPMGVTVGTIFYVDSTKIKMKFNYDNSDFEIDKLFTITIAGSELAGGNPLTSGQLNIVAFNETTAASKDSIFNLNAITGSASAAQLFIVTGNQLLSNMAINAPANFEVSNISATAGYANLVLYTPVAGVVNDTIWVRMKATAPAGINSGNITLISAKATVTEIFVKGTSAEAGNLIISQIYEGAGNSKYIEISNLGNSSVDLANPQMIVKMYANVLEIGTNTPTSTVNLTGTLLPGQSLLIKHGSVAAPAYAMTYTPNIINNGVCGFNGVGTGSVAGVNTDIIALYQNSDLKDVFGWGTMVYADSSYIRKVNIYAPNATFNKAEWTTLTLPTVGSAAVNTNERLGYHKVTNPDEIALDAEILKYMTTAFVARTINANDGIDTIVVKLKAGQTADGTITISRQPADGIYLKTAANAYLLKAQRITPIDTIENATLSFTKGTFTKNLTVIVTIQSTIIDNTAPSFIATYPKAVNISETGFDLAVQTDESSNTYYVVVANNATAPSVAEVVAGQQNGGTAAIKAGTINVVSANATYTAALTGLAIATDYDVYFVAKDKSIPSNTQVAVTKLDVKTSSAPTRDLFFSEYLEGGSNNKAIEIYNPTSNPVNLTNYTVKLGANGGSWGNTFVMTGILAPGAVYVIANSGSVVDILNIADTTSSVAFFNGDDALGLFKNGNLIDAFGIYLNDPGSSWDVAGITGATANHTLVRKWNVRIGDTSWTASAGTTIENSQWVVYEQDDFTFLGSHDTIAPNYGPAITNILTNPVAPTSDNNVFVSASIIDVNLVDSAVVTWGISSSALNNAIVMNKTTGDTYQTTTAIPAQLAGTTVYYKIKAFDGLGASSVSTVYSYSVSVNVTESNKFEATIYPNPAKNNVNINFGKTTQGEIIMYNANGQVVITKKVNDSFVTIPLNDLSQGMYMLQIKDNNGAVITRKISVQ